MKLTLLVFSLGAALCCGLIVATAQQPPAGETNPTSTPTAVPKPAVTPIATNWTKDAYGNPHHTPTIVSDIPSPTGRWQMLISEVTPQRKMDYGNDFLMIIDIQSAPRNGTPKTVWRTFRIVRLASAPIISGSLANTNGQLTAMISSHDGWDMWLELFHIDPAVPVLPPQPSFLPNGILNFDRQKLPPAFFTGKLILPKKPGSPSLWNIQSISMDFVSDKGMLITIHEVKYDYPTEPNVVHPEEYNPPLRMGLNFGTKKWWVLPPDKAAKEKWEKEHRHKVIMSEYRHQREFLGFTKEQSIKHFRTVLKDPNWNPDPEPWDTPDLKPKAPWLNPTPAATATPVTASPPPR